MQLIIKKQIGKNTYPFTFEGKNLHEVVMESKKLSFYDIPKCGLCGSDNLVLSAHVAQGKFKYTEIRCVDCRGQLTFGQTQEDPDTFYLRKNDGKYDWQVFEPKDNKSNKYGKSLNEKQGGAFNSQEDDDLPF